MGLRENLDSVENITRSTKSILDTVDGMEDYAKENYDRYLAYPDEEDKMLRNYFILWIFMIIATILICIFVV